MNEYSKYGAFLVFLLLNFGLKAEIPSATKGHLLVSETLYIPLNKTVHIILGEEIQKIDVGSEQVLYHTAHNRIQLKAAQQDFEETNLMVETRKGYAMFILRYADEPPKLFYNYSKLLQKGSDTLEGQETQQQEGAIATQSSTSKYKSKCEQVLQKKRHLRTIGMQEQNVSAELECLLAAKNELYLRIKINNQSSIDYEIDCMRFSVCSAKNKHIKQSYDLSPVYILYEDRPCIEPGTSGVRVIVFKKFTMAKNKRLIVDIREKSGGRRRFFTLTPQELNHAKRF